MLFFCLLNPSFTELKDKILVQTKQEKRFKKIIGRLNKKVEN